MTVEVVYSPRGALDAVECATWWIEHHSQNPDAVEHELTKTVALIKQSFTNPGESVSSARPIMAPSAAHCA